jgi:hypothetical protein
MKGTLVSVDQYHNVKLSDMSVVDADKYPHLVRRLKQCPRVPLSAQAILVFCSGSRTSLFLSHHTHFLSFPRPVIRCCPDFRERDFHSRLRHPLHCASRRRRHCSPPGFVPPRPQEGTFRVSIENLSFAYSPPRCHCCRAAAGPCCIPPKGGVHSPARRVLYAQVRVCLQCAYHAS